MCPKHPGTGVPVARCVDDLAACFEFPDYYTFDCDCDAADSGGGGGGGGGGGAEPVPAAGDPITCSMQYFEDANCATPFISTHPDAPAGGSLDFTTTVKGLGKDQCTDDDRPPKHEYFAYVSECAADTVTWAWGDATCAAVDNCQSDKRQAVKILALVTRKKTTYKTNFVEKWNGEVIANVVPFTTEITTEEQVCPSIFAEHIMYCIVNVHSWPGFSFSICCAMFRGFCDSEGQ